MIAMRYFRYFYSDDERFSQYVECTCWLWAWLGSPSTLSSVFCSWNVRRWQRDISRKSAGIILMYFQLLTDFNLLLLNLVVTEVVFIPSFSRWRDFAVSVWCCSLWHNIRASEWVTAKSQHRDGKGGRVLFKFILRFHFKGRQYLLSLIGYLI